MKRSQASRMKDNVRRDEELAKLSTPELIELAIEIMDDIMLRIMEAAGEEGGDSDV